MCCVPPCFEVLQCNYTQSERALYWPHAMLNFMASQDICVVSWHAMMLWSMLWCNDLCYDVCRSDLIHASQIWSMLWCMPVRSGLWYYLCYDAMIYAMMYASQIWSTLFLEHDNAFSTPMQVTHMASVNWILRIKPTSTSWCVLRECMQEPLQFYWFRSAVRFLNNMVDSNSNTLHAHKAPALGQDGALAMLAYWRYTVDGVNRRWSLLACSLAVRQSQAPTPPFVNEGTPLF